jgi:hypothetical protein
MKSSAQKRESRGLTVRTHRVLSAVAELSAQGSNPNNRQVADAAGITDQGQISKLLSRLEGHGLLQNTGGSAQGVAAHPPRRGAPARRRPSFYAKSTHDQGDTVKPQGTSAKQPHTATGIFATLRASVSVKGTGTPSSARLCVFVSLLTIAAAFALTATPALAARGHVFAGHFGGKGTGAGQFKEPSGVAVNEATGDVYVVDKGNNRVEYFSATGTYEGEFNGSGLNVNEGPGFPIGTYPGQFSEPEGIAVDNTCFLNEQKTGQPLSSTECEALDPSNGDVYVVDRGHEVVDKFGVTGNYVGQITEAEGSPLAQLAGVGVDTSGGLWVYGNVSNGFPGVVRYSYAVANEFVEIITLEAFYGSGFTRSAFAVSSENDLYTALGRVGGPETETRVSKYTGSGKLLSEEVDSEDSTAVAVETSSDDAYIDNASTVGRFSDKGTLLERLGAAQLTDDGGAGVGVSSSSETLYVADSIADVVDMYQPEMPSTPTVESESVSLVTGDSATFSAEVNPRSLSGEHATEYDFEYGSCASLSACATSGYEPVPGSEGTLAASFNVDTVAPFNVQGLAAGTVYHFRVVAHNKNGTVDGEDRTFTTQAAGGELVLPDGREWELVSPPDKHGALIDAIDSGHVTQAAADGSAISYLAASPTEAEPSGYTNLVQVLSMRGASGWASQDLTPPHVAATGDQEVQEYRAFSADLSSAALQPLGGFDPSLSPEASEQTAFLRSDYANGNTGSPCLIGCYRPLVTGAAGYANVPQGTHFGEEGACPPRLECGPRFAGATSDFSHIVLHSAAPLSSEGPGFYEWSAGKLALIAPAADVPELGYHNDIVRNAISADGSRVAWTTHGGHLFMTDVPLKETVQLDTVQPGASGANSGEHPVFEAASSDGSRVFFVDGQQLTPNSGAEPKGRDLYECEMVVTGGNLECKLSDLTPVYSGQSALVLNHVSGVSEDGAYVYFVADGVLASNTANGERAAQGTCRYQNSAALCNLYVAHYTGTSWETKLVAVLSGEDYPDWVRRRDEGNLEDMTARVSPNGHWLAFMSDRDLTGYDTRDAASGKPDEEVYLYDALSGKVVCASCDPTGARPVGVEFKNLEPGLDGARPWEENRWISASVPAWTSSGDAQYQSRYLSDSGRLFFNSSDALVSQDVNGTGDVYEYEPEGIEGPEGKVECSEGTSSGSDVYVPREHGCVALISSGSSPEESGFLDASETGGDVFFRTTAKLSPEDYDTNFDVYDAHECTQSSSCFPTVPATPPVCDTGDSCKAAPTPQPAIFGAPASATFSGAGDVAPQSKPAVVVKKKTVKCKRGFVKNNKSKCVKRKKSKRAKKSAHASRRASR